MRFTILPLLFLSLACAAQEPLGGTARLTDAGDFSARMVEGIGSWLEKETARVAADRDRRWHAATASEWPAFAEARREELRKILGAVDPRTPGEMEEIIEPGATPVAKDRHGFTTHRVRWPALANVHGEGVLLCPTGVPLAVAIVIPDADQAPESSALAQELAARGCVVLAVTLVDRRDTWSGNAALNRFTNQPHREWIQRQAFEVGRTITGYEVQRVLAAIDALALSASRLKIVGLPICVAGAGEGGLIALHCAALDPRIAATLVSGSFGPRERLFAAPLYRNAFGLLQNFGDAELAALIAPRHLIVDASGAPEINGPPAASPGRTGAAPGAIVTPPIAAVAREVARVNDLRATISGAAPVSMLGSALTAPLTPTSIDAAQALLARLGYPESLLARREAQKLEITAEQIDARQHRAVSELEAFTQNLLRDAERARTAAVLAKAKPGTEWEAAQSALRTELAEKVIGRIAAERSPSNPRSRLIREEPKWRGYEVALDVLPEVFAWGWLLVPRDLQPGERRPVVVCQHGLEGLPEDVVTTDEKSPAWKYYKGFATRLVEQGFIVYAPHNPYRGKDAFRMLQRRANPLGLSLYSFIVAQHEVTTDWLASLPFVDPQRIAFYGLSYGGKTAMRVPALIPRYCLSICSGDFNEWIYKVASPELRMSYLFTPEWEIDEWNLAWVANYAELAMLIAPRPFMVERGHDDGVGLDEWVAYEYAKVRRGYTKLGIGERTEIEWFDGPHTIHGVGTFDFLHRHLRWPTR